MNKLLNSLNQICNDHLLETKVLIMPSYATGNQLKELAAIEGVSLLNLKVETLIGLTQCIASNYLHKTNQRFINDTLKRLYISNILRQLKQNNELIYFSNIEITPGIVKVVYGAIDELRMFGYKSSTLDESDFISNEKGLDIIKIMKMYEEELIKNNFVDEQNMYEIILKNCRNEEQIVYIIPDNLKLSQVEYDFLNHISKKTLYVLETGIRDSNKYYETNCISDYFKKEKFYKRLSDSSKNIFCYLYTPENIPDKVNNLDINLMQAYGEYNETKSIISNIKANNLPFDQTNIYYTVQEPYSQYIYNLMQKHDIPITFGEGISIKNTNPGKLFFSLLEWIDDNYSFSKLCNILINGYLKLEEVSPSNYFIARYLRKLNIGWGKERYLECIENDINNNEKRYQEQNRLTEYRWIKSFAEELLCMMPQIKNSSLYNTNEITEAIIEIVDKYSRVANEMDAEAKTKLLEELHIIEEYPQEDSEIKEIIRELSSYIESIRVRVSSQQPGHIHLTSYKKGIWSTRKNTFVIGMDSDKFPGKITEDPILLDIERKKISRELALSKNALLQNYNDMTNLLMQSRNQITISYSNYNTVDNKIILPSSLLLQIFRLKTKDSSKDYRNLMNFFDHNYGYTPKELAHIMDDIDWWLYKHINRIRNKDDLLDITYQNLRLGLTAVHNRMEEDFTHFDGKVIIDKDFVDPRVNKDIIMSSSSLEQIAKCPFGYYLKNVLNIRAPEEVEYDPGKWLDAMTRGTLLHSIYEIFYKEINSKDERPSLDDHEDLIYNIVNKQVEALKEELPPSNELIYELERREILTSCKIFLINECDNFQDSKPTYFELSFGLKDEYHEEFGVIEPVEIKLPRGDSIKMRGRIDRIDRNDDKTFNILDYKTGSTYGFNHRQYFEKGRKLQHAIYAKVFEKILKDKRNSGDAIVDKSGYLFPTLRGEGALYLKEKSTGIRNREEVLDLIEKLLDTVSSGSFIGTAEDSDCKYCDYSEICDRDIYSEVTKSIREDHGDTGLELLRGIGLYE